MKNYKIRLNTFETNSSSAHTFVLCDSGPEYTTDEEIQEWIERGKMLDSRVPDGYIVNERFLTGDDYGSQFEILTKWWQKMSYLLASFKYDFSKLRKVINVLKKRIPRMKGLALSYSSYDNSYFDKEEQTPYYNSDWYDLEIFGEIDHQSSDNTENAMKAMLKTEKFKNMSFEELVYEIIFSKEIIIITDSDCSDTISDLFASGYCDTNNYKYVLKVKYDWLTNGDYTTDADFITIKEHYDEYNNEDDE